MGIRCIYVHLAGCCSKDLELGQANTSVTILAATQFNSSKPQADEMEGSRDTGLEKTAALLRPDLDPKTRHVTDQQVCHYKGR